MKYTLYTLFGLLQIILWSCNGNLSGKPQAFAQHTPSKMYPSSIVSDTLQFLEEGENEDNLFGWFINKKLDTLSIVWDELRNRPKKDAMFECQWIVKEVISGGNAEIRYEQAFMLSSKPLSIPLFVDHSIPKEQLRLNYYFYANGGTIGYLNNGTVVGCPRCDASPENAKALLHKPPKGAYRELDNGRLLINGTTVEYPKINKKFNDWLIFNSREAWLDYIQPTPEFVGKSYKANIGYVCMETSEPDPCAGLMIDMILTFHKKTVEVVTKKWNSCDSYKGSETVGWQLKKDTLVFDAPLKYAGKPLLKEDKLWIENNQLKGIRNDRMNDEIVFKEVKDGK